MKRKRKSKKQYMQEIDTAELSEILKAAGFTKRGMAIIVNSELDEDDAYRKWKYWAAHGRMPKCKYRKMLQVIQENENMD